LDVEERARRVQRRIKLLAAFILLAE